MKIASSTLQMASSHSRKQQFEVSESLRSQVGKRRADSVASQRPVSPVPNPVVQVSDAGKAAQSSQASAIQDGIDAAENDPMLRLIRAMIAMLTGKEVKILDASTLQNGTPAPVVEDPNPSAQTQTQNQTQAQTAQRPAAGYGVDYARHESYSESEQTTLAASGVVHTSDGKEISFSVSLSMTRSYHEESDISIRAGDAPVTKDPLVVNFAGTAAQLTSQRFKFDLNADGQSEDINFVAGGSGFLALDRNADGRINNGSELFGAKSGDGFAELAALDSDANGWIDENDAAFSALRVWTKNAAGKDLLSTLKEAGIGALSLAHVATPFALKDAANALQGEVKASGVFLRDEGSAGTLQQIDLTV